MLTGLAGYSVNPRINYGARKLTRTPRIIYKKIQLIIMIEGVLFFSFPFFLAQRKQISGLSNY
jgi:hypothetical protein